MDWKKLILEIMEAGMTQMQIADHVGRSQAWVSAVALGKYSDLRWADGEALKAVHAETVKKAA